MAIKSKSCCFDIQQCSRWTFYGSSYDISVLVFHTKWLLSLQPLQRGKSHHVITATSVHNQSNKQCRKCMRRSCIPSFLYFTAGKMVNVAWSVWHNMTASCRMRAAFISCIFAEYHPSMASSFWWRPYRLSCNLPSQSESWTFVKVILTGSYGRGHRSCTWNGLKIC